MRPGEFWEAIRAWQADKEADRRHVAEMIRGVGFRLFNIQLAQKDRVRDIRKFFPLPWDEEDDIDEEALRLSRLSQEERDKEAQAFMKNINFD